MYNLFANETILIIASFHGYRIIQKTYKDLEKLKGEVHRLYEYSSGLEKGENEREGSTKATKSGKHIEAIRKILTTWHNENISMQR